MIRLRFDTPPGPMEAEVNRLVVAGWTGRDRAVVDHHIAELAELGVPAPSAVPLYYRLSTSLLSTASEIEVLGATSSGEIEPFLLQVDGALWLGLASDQTDRQLESVSVAASKQACAKPVAPELWPFGEVESHLDAVTLHCEIEEDGEWVTYQKGPLSAIRPLRSLAEGACLTDGAAMLCGTLGAIGGVRPARAYRMVMHDPVLDRRLTLAYRVTPLPVIA